MTREVDTRSPTIWAAAAALLALASWVLSGSDESRLLLTIGVAAFSAGLAFAARLVLHRRGVAYDAPINHSIGVAAYTLAIGVGSGLNVLGVIVAAVAGGAIAYLAESLRVGTRASGS